jgi:hypothetical protein
LRVIHWGRPINYLGPNPEEGRRLGYGRDLLNMLLMNFSEKRPSDDLTGKFGLGFKSVHVLSDSVGIACGFLSLRTQGGFLPKDWHAGIDAAEKLEIRRSEIDRYRYPLLSRDGADWKGGGDSFPHRHGLAASIRTPHQAYRVRC